MKEVLELDMGLIGVPPMGYINTGLGTATLAKVSLGWILSCGPRLNLILWSPSQRLLIIPWDLLGEGEK